MIEATFPLLGTAFVVLIVLPAFALLAKAGLVMLERPIDVCIDEGAVSKPRADRDDLVGGIG